MKQKITLLLFSLLFIGLTYSQAPRMQVIHNAADAALSTVDVYVEATGFNQKIEDVAFRNASEYIVSPLNIDINITIKVAPGNSSSSSEAFFTKQISLLQNKTYVVVAEGIKSGSTGYTPVKPFDLYVYDTARETASNASNTDILVHHGATDAPTVDINNVTGGTSSVLVNDISYSEFSANYLELPTADYQINVTTADGATVVKTYNAPLSTLGLTGQAITVVASGFLDPSVNNNGPAFGLWAAKETGGNLIELQEVLSVDKFNFSAFNLYPNPVSNTLTVNLEKFENVNASIMDAYGRQVASFDLTAKQTHVNVSNLASGLYFVQLSTNTNVSKAIKVIVE